MATKKNKKKKRTQSKKPKRKRAAPRKSALKKRRVRGRSQRLAILAVEPEGLKARAGGQSGDLQGLPSTAGADSESIDELLEEGNAFEAEVVKGVQDAAEADESEVVSHEVPVDDVPEEYLDKER